MDGIFLKKRAEALWESDFYMTSTLQYHDISYIKDRVTETLFDTIIIKFSWKYSFKCKI